MDHAPTSCPEFEPDHPSRQFALSTFTPPPVDILTLDYDTVMAEINRLSRRVQELKMAAARLA